MRVQPLLLPALFVAALLGTVFTAQAAGVWSVSGRSAVALDSLTPADIKGWMTLQQVADGLGLDLAAVYAAGGLPAGIAPATALKELEALVPGFETSAFREALAGGANLPTPVITPTPSPTPAPAIPTPTLIAHTGEGPGLGQGDGTGAGPTPLPAGQILPADQVRGRMTLREVSDQCAVPLDRLLAALRLPADTDPAAKIKDLIAQGAFADVDAVQAAVAALQP